MHRLSSATLALVLCACSGGTTDELGRAEDGGARVDGGTGREDVGDDASLGPQMDAGEPGLDAAQEMPDGAIEPALDAGLDAAAIAAMDAGGNDAGTIGDAGGLDAATSGASDAGGSDASTIVDAAVAVTAFEEDFEDTLPAGLDPGTGTLTPSQEFASLGPVGNTFGATFLRSATANVVTLTLSDLPPHTSLSLELLFAAIDSLDGTGSFPAGDFFTITLDGQQIFRESFANALDSQIQSYVPPPGVELARRIDLGFQGPGGYYTDSAYDLGQDPAFQNIPHSQSNAVLTFTLEGDGVQSLDDESWAIDNVRVLLGDTPRASVDAGP